MTVGSAGEFAPLSGAESSHCPSAQSQPESARWQLSGGVTWPDGGAICVTGLGWRGGRRAVEDEVSRDVSRKCLELSCAW